MSRRVAAYVHVAGQVFAPGDEVPDDIAEKITNPAAWEQESDKAEDKPVVPRGDKAPARRRTTKE